MNSNIHSDAGDVMKTSDMGFRYAAEVDGTDQLWNRLGSRKDQRDPFCCLPAWQLAFNESRDPKSRILIRQSQDSLIAFSQRSFRPNVRRPSDYYLKSIEHSWCFGSNVLGPNGAELLYDTLIDLDKDSGKPEYFKGLILINSEKEKACELIRKSRLKGFNQAIFVDNNYCN